MPTFTTPTPITAALTTAGARVRIAAGGRADTVVRVEPVDSANPKDVEVAEKTKVDFVDGVLVVKTTKSGDRNGSVAITVELPAGSSLVLNTAWTEVRAVGVLGDCEVNIGSGQVRLDRVAALRGNLGVGGLAVGHVTGSAVIEGSSADVRIGEVDGVVRYRGTTGKVWIGRARSDIDLGGSNGSFDVGRADGGVIARAAACPIRIGRVTRGRVEAMNASGGIEIGVGEGTSAEVDAKSTKGLVRSTVFTQDDPEVQVHVRTRLDDIVVHRVAA
ncbi:hypothetical protein [Lentzea flaviverrucosa]|uniref:Adhesin n=1 Tax=Lentzea flaviverrucosa TaxID=200379 RepID=A0A1H8ZUM7_9PSEU|nr:hypothetical protein [Lentzea flaviverrucosa]RDI32244.1 hypothetical protein DFR72_103645 [Lentzea flaviverrucosa]SEP68160.1 hypothetical protein SAMN05216195_10113 [Lentzea flaviverrucosa]